MVAASGAVEAGMAAPLQALCWRLVPWCALVVAAACAPTLPQQSVPANEAPATSSTAPSPPPITSHRDELVLDAVLRDLLSAESGETPVSVRGRPPEKLFLRSLSASRRTSVDDVLYRYRAESWEQLPAAEEPLLNVAARSLVERSRNVIAIRSADPRVEIVEPGEGATGSWAERPIVAWPPGFSLDECLAVVRLHIPSGLHFSTATYVLSQRGAEWEVVVRQFIEHP